jgi:hypothetical protein
VIAGPRLHDGHSPGSCDDDDDDDDDDIRKNERSVHERA